MANLSSLITVFTATDKSKLDGIESGATADQTAGEIKTLYESNADTNAFTDALQTKLNGIEALADVTDATNVDAAGAVMNSDTTTAAMSFVIDEDTMTSNSDTKVPTQQSVKAYVDSAVSGGVTYKGGYNASTNTPDLDVSPSGVSVGDMYTTTVAGNFYSTALEVGDVLIAESATPASAADWTIVQGNIDYTAAQIKSLYESNSDTNAFTDAFQTKLNGIEALADVTDATNVDAAGATMNTDTTLVGNGYFLDEDSFASNDATKVASQQSIKAYVDTQIAGVSSGMTWLKKTAAYTAADGEGIIADTSGGTFTVTLPATPAAGALVGFADGANWGTNNLTVARNGSTIEGATEDLTVNIADIMFSMIYDGATWKVYQG